MAGCPVPADGFRRGGPSCEHWGGEDRLQLGAGDKHPQPLISAARGVAACRPAEPASRLFMRAEGPSGASAGLSLSLCPQILPKSPAAGIERVTWGEKKGLGWPELTPCWPTAPHSAVGARSSSLLVLTVLTHGGRARVPPVCPPRRACVTPGPHLSTLQSPHSSLGGFRHRSPAGHGVPPL